MLIGNEELHKEIIAMLDTAGVSYKRILHPPAHTSQQSADFRQEPLAIGGKSLLLKIDDEFRLFVLSAELAIDNLLVRRLFGTRRTRFATKKELSDMTGLVPGCVPPFGKPILPFPIYVDPSVLANERIGFNAALLTESVIMATKDWMPLVQPEMVVPFSKRAED
jgi:Ala-tRNA(Pro) deacylase